MPKIFYVQLTVGNSEFFGEGKTRQAARHNAAMKALQALQNEPIPEKLPQVCASGNFFFLKNNLLFHCCVFKWLILLLKN